MEIEPGDTGIPTPHASPDQLIQILEWCPTYLEQHHVYAIAKAIGADREDPAVQDWLYTRTDDHHYD